MRMHDPAHPSEIARDNVEAEGWTVNEWAARLGVSRITLSRLLNGRAGVSAAMALALERIGWGRLPSMSFLKIHRAEVTQRRVEPFLIVGLVQELR